MKLSISKSKNSVSFYISESFRNKNGNSTSRVVKKLGTLIELQEQLGPNVDIEQWCRNYVKELNAKAKAQRPLTLTLELPVGVSYAKGCCRSYNVGYLFLQKMLYALGIDKIGHSISKRHNYDFDLTAILADLVYARVLAPQSKLSSFDFCNDFLLEKPDYLIHDVYRALDVIAKESAFIQSSLYKASLKAITRDTSVLYYDCTNFFFEISAEDELRKYGQSKENRPQPIVQMGLFMDGSGIPLAFNITPGNRNEQLTLLPLEKQILQDFELAGAELTVCADAGLCSAANKAFNSRMHRNYIVIRPIKKMSRALQSWALDPGRSLEAQPLVPGENPEQVKTQIQLRNWQCHGLNGFFALDDIDESNPKVRDLVFYKEKYIVDDDGNLIERVIVTFSLKYKYFMQKKRERDLMRARKLIHKKLLNKSDLKKTNDVTRYIKVTNTTVDGQEAVNTDYAIDWEEVTNQSRYDGFYAVSTSYTQKQKTATDIAVINKRRWELEESFMLLKSEFKARPVYLQKQERIHAHFMLCFIALMVFRAVEQKVNLKRKDHFTAHEIISTLRAMNVNKIGAHYTGGFIRTDITDALQEFGGMKFDCELITESLMQKHLKQSKKF